MPVWVWCPGAEVTVEETPPSEGPLTLRIGDTVKAIAREMAASVLMTAEESTRPAKEPAQEKTAGKQHP